MNKLKVYRVSYIDPSDKAGKYNSAAVVASKFYQAFNGFTDEFGADMQIVDILDTKQVIDLVVGLKSENK